MEQVGDCYKTVQNLPKMGAFRMYRLNNCIGFNKKNAIRVRKNIWTRYGLYDINKYENTPNFKAFRIQIETKIGFEYEK